MNIKKYDLKELEVEITSICEDFDVFCDYVLEKKVKLAKNTRNIGKKDCFALNAFFNVKEDYEKPTHVQNQYPIINFFYYFAVKYKILEVNATGTMLQQGKHYRGYHDMSAWEQYVMFLVLVLFDGKFAGKGSSWYASSVAETWDLYVDGFMGWFCEENISVGSRHQISTTGPIAYFSNLEELFPYLEELNLIKIWNRPVVEKWSEEYWWGIEALPLLELVSELYENAEIDEEKVVNFDTLIRYSYEAFMDMLMPEKKDCVLWFGNAEEQDRERTIELEVTVRYTECIRVIKMNMGNSLYDLHMMIQEAVSFDDDHMFEFSVGEGMLRKVYALPMNMSSGREGSVMETTLGDLDLHKGQMFSYLFDFGDMWWFDIKVLSIQEGSLAKPEVIKAINDAPQQYPFWEEDMEGWQAEITGQVEVSNILDSIADEVIRTECVALQGLRAQQQKGFQPGMRVDIARILLENPDRMLAFMTTEMRNVLSKLLQEEWIDGSEKSVVLKLCSLGFCTFSEEDEYVVLVPQSVKDVYAAKLKAAAKQDKIVEVAELFLKRCGVMETDVLYAAVVKVLKRRISYNDFEFLIYSRLHYFGPYYCECYNEKEYISCYDWEMTEKILTERLKPENVLYDYPDFEKLYSGQKKETPKALRDWSDYIKFNLNIDWRMAQELITKIPAMATSGVIGRDDIVAMYKEILSSTRSRVTKKAEKLITELCATLPLATRKGSVEPVGDSQVPQKQEESKKTAGEEEYRQLSLFD